MAYAHTTPVVYAAKRTPHGLFGGQCFSLHAHEWMSPLLRACAQESQGHEVRSVVLGCVLSAGLGQAPARQATLTAGLPDHTHAMHINKVCGSGMMAVIHACQDLYHDPAQLILAGGMESMSGAPCLVNGRFGYRFGHQTAQDHLLYDGLEDAYDGEPMGCLAEDVATSHKLSRDVQDDYAIHSAKRALEADESGFFDQERMPIKGHKHTLDRDETLSRVKVERVKTLTPAFKKDGTITPATSSALADGASVLGLTSWSHLKNTQLQPRAAIVGWASFSGPPRAFTLAPIGAVNQLLHDLSWRVEDVDAWEVNEAFAVVPLALQKTLGLSQDNLNMWGGALALGHPLGSSGSRILVTLLHVLEHTQGRRGVAAICIGGGEGLAVAIERIDREG
ncbi:thiolase family protein [Candidatus Hepatobacter penaei]|uniref:thiolase family protein n=1 Tax=Candidatus Hepatobacter penaei TaxID=1274402 RepID=UPI0004F34E3E|nr:thiolase family protein [Candidatus Hepatobacter penaei]